MVWVLVGRSLQSEGGFQLSSGGHEQEMSMRIYSIGGRFRMNDLVLALLLLCSPVLISDVRIILLIFPKSASEATWVLTPLICLGPAPVCCCFCRILYVCMSAPDYRDKCCSLDPHMYAKCEGANLRIVVDMPGKPYNHIQLLIHLIH